MDKTIVRYPIGIQSFESLRTLQYLYVDKTELIYNLVTTSKCVFLSRPRRFGKSLLLSTIQAYFEGKRDLFKGLAIENLENEWTVYPVLILSLATFHASDDDNLEEILDNQFREWEKQYGVESETTDLSSRFRNIIKAAYKATCKPVAILIDEYDNPVIETMSNPTRCETYRRLLTSIYVNVKDLDQYIRFTMMTGASRNSMTTTFGGLNNLKDISRRKDYASICGITEKELKDYFQQGIENIATIYKTDTDGAIQLLKADYGYQFAEGCLYINSFSLLWALDNSDGTRPELHSL